MNCRAVAAALLPALAAAAAAQVPVPPPLAARIAVALQRARPALLHHLATADSGVLALCCLAAAHDDVPTDEPVFARALDRLARAELDDTYGLALRLMLLAEVPSFPGRVELARRDAALLQTRQTGGGFSYHAHDGWWDLSNTQYAALGLRAAAALGVDVPERRWLLLHDAMLRMQLADGGFTYRAGQGRPSAYESMAVAGIAVLQVSAQFLALDDAARAQHDDAVTRAWQWLAAHKQSIGDRRTHCGLYFHYGLERAAILSDVDYVGGVNWYAAGAAMLCGEQTVGGGWWGIDESRAPAMHATSGHPVDTAFAVLFLRRRFQKVPPAVTVARPSSAGLWPDADAATVAAAAAYDASGGAAQLPELLALLHSEVVTRRKAAVLAIFRITGWDCGVHPYRSPDAEAERIRAAELWWLRRQARP
jgi:hypothetical protein